MSMEYHNTLYVTTQESYLHKSGENIVIKIKDEKSMRIPIHTIQGIVCFGRVTLSFPLLGFCMEKNLQVSFLTVYGKFLGRVTGKTSGNVLLRRQQHRLADDPVKRLAIASNMVVGKILNQRAVLRRYVRDHGDTTKEDSLRAISDASGHLTLIAKTAKKSTSLDALRGFEGEASSTYFGNFDTLIKNRDFGFKKRSRRPPMDSINAMLSFAYTILMHDISSALETTSLDPAVGFLHADRPGRLGLALDMMEEFRPWLADRLVLSMINRSQLSAGDFETMENGACMMSGTARRKFLTAYQKRKQVEVKHLFLDKVVPVGLTWFLQARILARHIRGDTDEYPPFVWK